MTYIGDFAEGTTLRHFWSTNGPDGSSITRATDGSIRIYKDSSDTQRTSSNGVTDAEDVDSLTGTHRLTVDLADNTDAGFYAAGHDYHAVIVGAVIDGITVNVPLCSWSIENRSVAAASLLTAADVWSYVTRVLTDDTNIAIPTATEIADAILTRASSNWEASAGNKSLGAAIMKVVHKVDTASNPGYETTFRSDGTTEHMKQPITTDAAADGVTEQGPTEAP